MEESFETQTAARNRIGEARLRYFAVMNLFSRN